MKLLILFIIVPSGFGSRFVKAFIKSLSHALDDNKD